MSGEERHYSNIPVPKDGLQEICRGVVTGQGLTTLE